MGHDIHFLNRLDRVSLPHVELAMSLYNDTPLLQFILGKVGLPDATERVAISLADPERGPFLVVARNGRFVTCLGEGMSTQDLPVITRSQLDTLAEKASDLRERMAVAERLVGKDGKVSKLLRRLFTAGAQLSREEFIGVSAWQPLLCKYFLAYAIDSARFVHDLRGTLRKIKQRPNSREVSALRDYWNHLWAIGHLIALFAMDARELLEEDEVFAQVRGIEFSWPAVRQGFVPVGIRGAWAAGKLGKRLLSGYKAAIAQPSTPLQMTNAVYGVIAMAARHRRLRGEIRKVLHGEHSYPEGILGELIEGIVKVGAAAFDLAFDHHDEMRPFQQDIGGELFIRQASRVNPDAPPRYATAAEVPESLRLAAFANAFGVDLSSVDAKMHVLLTLPWIAAAPPEDLYYPAEVMPEVGVPFIPELVMKLIQEQTRNRQPQPVRAEKVPGRNEPCSCGSGKKYKRCCALGGESEADAAER